MRSDHADPGSLTGVRFDFSLGDEPLSRRADARAAAPQGPRRGHDRARCRRPRSGGCAATAPTSSSRTARRWRPAGAGSRRRPRTSSGSAPSSSVRSSCCPQGRFQQFLEADSGQREQILRALFETGRYADIERALHDEALALKRAADTITTQRDEVLREAEADDAETLADRCARLAVDQSEAREHAQQAARDDAAAQQALAGRQRSGAQAQGARRRSRRGRRPDCPRRRGAGAADGARGRPARRRGSRRGATGRRDGDAPGDGARSGRRGRRGRGSGHGRVRRGRSGPRDRGRAHERARARRRRGEPPAGLPGTRRGARRRP